MDAPLALGSSVLPMSRNAAAGATAAALAAVAAPAGGGGTLRGDNPAVPEQDPQPKALARWRHTWNQRDTGDRLQSGVVGVAVVALAFGLFASRALAQSVTDDGSVSMGVWVTGFTVYVAAGALGAFVGFLFGLPRPQDPSQQTNPGDPASATQPTTSFLTNSNLLKVSDWLTTIVVGLTLVNLLRIRTGILQLVHAFDEPLGGAAHSGLVGVALAVISILIGFVACYLWTTVHVRNLLIRAEEERGKAQARVAAYAARERARPAQDGG